ncbi:MAG: hypothetical protein HXS41_00965 [Theionarchaea archaeon]|nr:hypothetical protein [Theionarchaea archaeon]MBU6999277.1 hypothetical protein [Theionarchaea archaeon]MBU7019598.1 hypothetical protein [Theionarchaea archaeon]MBU7033777.1 hypothetical protein [Theionarchaea archaeon]MBU7039413.1 hypothetical protein [Theionarchaea archaeon]
MKSRKMAVLLLFAVIVVAGVSPVLTEITDSFEQTLISLQDEISPINGDGGGGGWPNGGGGG